MYKIIGADGKAYGPVTAEQIRFWINENRVNAQTQVQAEGTTDWRPLSAFPEFSDAFGVNAPAAPSVLAAPIIGNRDAALQAVKGPALALKITAIVGWVAVVLGLVMNVLQMAGIQLAPEPPAGAPRANWMALSGIWGIISGVISAAIGVVIFMGASKMEKLQNHSFAFTAAILAMLPCVSPCCILGLPLGIWALVVLNKPEVKSQFS